MTLLAFFDVSLNIVELDFRIGRLRVGSETENLLLFWLLFALEIGPLDFGCWCCGGVVVIGTLV
jgi:hypothetical protein